MTIDPRKLKHFVDQEQELEPRMPAKVQTRTWSCGPAAIVNAAAALGVDLDEDEVRELAGTTTDGTDEDGMLRAAAALGLDPDPVSGEDSIGMWNQLIASLDTGRACVLCMDRWSHWVAITGLVDGLPVMQDSETGTTGVIARDELLDRWSNDGEAAPFYMLTIGA